MEVFKYIFSIPVQYVVKPIPIPTPHLMPSVNLLSLGLADNTTISFVGPGLNKYCIRTYLLCAMISLF